MIVVYVITFLILLAASIMALVRIERGPSMFDRILGLDVITAVLIGMVTVIAAVTKRTDLVPVLIVLALVGFIGSTSIARFAAAESAEERRILSKDEVRQLMAQHETEDDDDPAVHDLDDEDEGGAVIVSIDEAEELEADELEKRKEER